MTTDESFQNFLQVVSARPLPSVDKGLVRLETFAKELAEGAVSEFWMPHITPSLVGDYEGFNEGGPRLAEYLAVRWQGKPPEFTLFRSAGYIQQISEYSYSLTSKAYDLLNRAEPIQIFISYRRSVSSAFALLVLARLKLVGLEGFLDLAIQPGENWHAGIRERIQQYDSFVLLLGPTTLKSDIVKQEIQWAIEFGLDILPIWHSGFAYNAEDWPDLPPDVKRVLQSNHSIRVLDESALGYNNAIVELLNRFGVTP